MTTCPRCGMFMLAGAEFNLNQKDIQFVPGRTNPRSVKFSISEGLAIWLLDNDDDQEYRVKLEIVPRRTDKHDRD